MFFLRWKWIFYHFISSLTAILACAIVILSLFPEHLSFLFQPITAGFTLIIVIGISVISALIGGFQSSKDFRNQLEEISLGAKELAYGNLDYRLKFHGNFEFDRIILAFNDMAKRLQSQVIALQNLAEENQQLIQDARLTAVSEERQRIARDLHDAVSQQLFAISMLAATASKIAPEKPEQAVEFINEISQSANRAQSEMRALLLQLRPLILQNETLSEALTSLAMELQSKQVVKCVMDLDDVNLSKNIENQLFRIAQEAISNALRHAEAEQVTIALKNYQANDRIILTIEDNGQGFNIADVSHSSIGMRSIKERTTLLGGTAHWFTAPGQGTKVEIRIPISTPSNPRSE